jgi:hypothetical protein
MQTTPVIPAQGCEKAMVWRESIAWGVSPKGYDINIKAHYRRHK